MSVGETIKKERENKGYTQSFLSEQVGITQAMLCQIERGTRNPSLQVAYEISKVLECSIESLVRKN